MFTLDLLGLNFPSPIYDLFINKSVRILIIDFQIGQIACALIMPSIPNTLYVIRDNGEFEITHDGMFTFLHIIIYSLLAIPNRCAT